MGKKEKGELLAEVEEKPNLSWKGGNDEKTCLTYRRKFVSFVFQFVFFESSTAGKFRFFVFCTNRGVCRKKN